MAEESKPGATVTQVPARLIRSKDFRVVFSNTFRFRVGQADIGIAFGYQSEIPGPGGQEQTILTDEVEVVLTPMMLKLFQLAISDNIETLETVLGKPIEIPQSILDGLANREQKRKRSWLLNSKVPLREVTKLAVLRPQTRQPTTRSGRKSPLTNEAAN